MVQWLRIHLAMQRTQFRSLVRELTPHAAEKLSSWAATTEVQASQLENLFNTVKDLV